MAEVTSWYNREDGVSLIEIKLSSVQQLFNSLDPAPFHEKDLDSDAEEYIVDAVRGLPLKEPLRLVFHLPPDQTASAAVATLADSIHNYFEYRRDATARDLRFLFHEGRRALAIGLAFLSACLVARHFLFMGSGTVTQIIGESLLIGGWVAMWRPMEIFLYEWWPIWEMRRIYAKLASIPVECRPAS